MFSLYLSQIKMSTALELDQRSNDSNGNDENGLDDRVRKQTTITAIGKVGQPCISTSV